ncbi:MAG: general secretion pathway protein GspK [Proteobacteria bacterium]|nr:general secretion pathway protein GspK [Pseudomonadota bacterium]
MQKKVVNNEKGIAILITLTIITILISVALELNRRVRSEVISAAVTRDTLVMDQMAASGIHIGIGILISDKEKDEKNHKLVDSVQEDWATPEKVDEVLADFPFDTGKLELSITDELSKIQVNALVTYPEGRQFNTDQRKLWDDILQYFIPESDSFDEVGTSGIVSSIKDWLDFGDDDAITGLNGAESDYYQDLDPPYSCKNGPLTHLEELVLIKGITPEMFYSVGEMLQLSRYITVYGMTKTQENRFTFEGKININTAELPVISALLPQGDEEVATQMIDYRIETSEENFVHDLSKPIWYKDVPGGSDVTISEKLITTVSDFFRIESKASKNNVVVTAEAVIERYKDNDTHVWTYRILSWKTD